MPADLLPCFAATAPGLEALLAGELAERGVTLGDPEVGGIGFEASPAALADLLLRLRTASRVSLRLATFRARTFAELEAGAADLDWQSHLGAGVHPTFRVSSHRSRLYHTDAIGERLTRVLEAEVGLPAGGGGPEQSFVVRIDRDRVTVSADSSGAPLHQRGWRPETGKAPLRETLAAALLLAVGWDGTVPLADPFCGAGTIVIEAAQLARGVAPGSDRTFAFAEWPDFEPGTWASVAGAAAGDRLQASPVAIVGRDRDAGAIDRTFRNAERAGVADDLDLDVAPVSALELPPGPGWVITNPPWGVRTGGGSGSGGDLRNLYARLGQVVAAAEGWSVGMLVADPRLAHHAGLPVREALTVQAGGRTLHLLVADAA